MTAITTGVQRSIRASKFNRLVVVPLDVAAAIPQGALVTTDTGGYGRDGVDTSGFKIAGIATAQGTGVTADGTVSLVCITECAAEFAIEGSTLTRANIGQNVSLKDNNTVCDALEASNDVVVGRLLDILANGNALVHVGVFGRDTADNTPPEP